MRDLARALVLACALFACHADSPTKPPANAPTKASAAKSIELFDGHSLAGWDGDPRFWSVQNGMIVGQSTQANPCSDTNYLIWRGGQVRDFDLACDFRIVGGNSGVQFRSAELGQWKVAGFQADMEDSPNWTGCLYDQDGAGVVATRGESVTLMAAKAERQRFADGAELLSHIRMQDWNHYRIHAHGAEVELEVNGLRTVAVIDRRPVRRLSGLLALQMHQGAPMRVEYKNFALVQQVPVEPLSVDDSAPAVTTPGALVFSGEKPQWIWSSRDTQDGDVATLARRFDVRKPPTRAHLRGGADNHMRVFVNGTLALEQDDWSQVNEVDVSKFVHEGENEIALAAKNDGGPAGAWLELIVEGGAGRIARVISDPSWSAESLPTDSNYASWAPKEFAAARAAQAHSFGAYGVAPWGSPTSAPPPPVIDEHATPGSELQLPAGFKADLLYSVPGAAQGSWISLCEDPAGRFYASDQYGALYRITVGADASATKVETVPVNLGGAHGLCWAFDSLYAVVAEGAHDHGLYRLRDSDGDGVLDQVTLLRKFDGGGEHGPHAVVLGPDQKLWIVGGNHTKLPEPIDVYRRPKNWQEDQLLANIPDPNGHAVGIFAPGGWVVRTDEKAEHWELWAAGFRNAYDIAFDQSGELFTFDSDMEWDIGAPWYKPTRVMHVVSGAEFGWRTGAGNWPADYPDALPSVCDVGLSSPTGMAFGYAAKFPAKYRRALFALDWAYGTIYAVHMTPKGSSFTGTFEKFCTGKPFPVTDVVVAHDGAMYVTTGGRRTQSGFYRITWTGELGEENAREEARLAKIYAAAQADRNRRKAFEDGHGEVTVPYIGSDESPMTVAAAMKAIRDICDPDPFVRHAVRVQLEHMGAPDLQVTQAQSIDGLVADLIASIHVHGAAARFVVLPSLATVPMKELDDRLLVDILRLHGLSLMRFAPLDEQTLADFRARLEPLYPSGRARIDRELAELLVTLDSSKVIEPSLAVMESTAPQEEKIWHAYCLRVSKVAWTIEQRRRFFTAIDELHRTAKGGFSLTKYVEEIRKQTIAALTDAEKAELGELVAPPAAASAPAAVAAHFVHAWTKAELLPLVNAALRGRDFENGKLAFSKTRCLECHRIAGEGGATGPDLTGAGSRFSRSDLLDAVIEPSKAISDQYQDTEILTKDGDLFVGRIERDDARGIALRRLPPQSDLVEFAKDEIERRRLHPLSRMPSGLFDTLGEAEILDLVAYVLSGADPANQIFR